MNKIYVLVLSLFLVFFTGGSVYAGAPNPDRYPFQKDIFNSKISQKTVIKIDLDQKILHAINDRLSNINLYNSENQEVPFSIFY